MVLESVLRPIRLASKNVIPFVIRKLLIHKLLTTNVKSGTQSMFPPVLWRNGYLEYQIIFSLYLSVVTCQTMYDTSDLLS